MRKTSIWFLSLMLVAAMVFGAVSVMAADAPALPTATVSEITNENLTFALNFSADQVTAQQLEYYGNWYADFELTVNKDITLYSGDDQTADGYLGGQYDGSWEDETASWNGQWVYGPFKAPVTIKAGETIKVMAYAAEMMGEPGLKYTYKEVYETVKNFDCGMFITEEYMQANPDFQVTLGLNMYNPANEEESYMIGREHTFRVGYVAENVQTGVKYTDVSDAMQLASAGQTVKLLNNAEDIILTVKENTTLDLNGYELAVNYASVFGYMVDGSASNAGALKVDANKLLINTNNKQLPVKTDKGYQFVEVVGFNTAWMNETTFVFQPLFEAAAHNMLKSGVAATGVSIQVEVTWKPYEGSEDLDSRTFKYGDTLVTQYINSYKGGQSYGKLFTLTLTNPENYVDLTCNTKVVSTTRVVFAPAGGTEYVTEEVQLTNEQASAVVAEGTKLKSANSKLMLTTTEMDETTSDVVLTDGETMLSMDVHVDGIAADNTVPVIVTLNEITVNGLNEGNIALYHVENGETVKMTRVYSLGEVDEHNEYYYDIATGTITMALKSFSEVAVVSDNGKGWQGGIDTTWYEEDKSSFNIYNADQLAGFGKLVDGGNTFEGKTVTLCLDVYLSDGKHADGTKSFNPIGYGYEFLQYTDAECNGYGKVFKGTFDGNGNTIYNLYQNGWAMGSAYEYSAVGGGLFASIVDAEIKNLTVDNAYIVMECVDMGVVVGYANGKCNFENIVVKNSTIANYQRCTGGVIGEVGGGGVYTLTNVDVEATTYVSSLWGDFDAPLGGIIGATWKNAGKYTGSYDLSITMERCDVAAVINAYNDVTSAYQWYSYRRAGMLIGNSEESTKDSNGRTSATASYLTAEDCTVQYGSWANYTYCRFSNTSSLNARYPWVRVQGSEFCGAYSNPRYGVPVVNGAAFDVTSHTFDRDHVEGDEGYHDVTIVFNQLYGGGQGCYGGSVHAEKGQGVTVLDTSNGAIVPKEKFASAGLTTVTPGATLTLGELFDAVDGATIQGAYVYAFLSPANEDSKVQAASVTPNASGIWQDWELTFNGEGLAKITISDYYYCNPTTIYVSVQEGATEPVEKFETKFTGDFLYRVGNQNTVSLNSLFKAKDGATIGTVSVTIEAISGSQASGTYTSDATWTKGTIQFNDTGVVKVTIYDDDKYCKRTELILEVVDAVNATTATNATANNVVLLNDIGSGFSVSGRYYFYGNGFTLNYTGNGQYLNNGLKQGVVTVSENGTLDNLRIKATIYPDAYLYFSNALVGNAVKNGPSSVEGEKTRYHYQLSAVAASGNATISNCYIYGGRNNIFINTGDVVVTDSVLECGVVSNVQIQSNSSHTVTFNNVTTIQYCVNATIVDTAQIMLGAGILVGPETNDNPTIVLNGDFKQYNWVNADDAENVSGEVAKLIINGALEATAYNHTVNGKTASNLGIIYMNTYDANVVNNTGLPYVLDTITMEYSRNSIDGKVYSLQGATVAQINSDYANADKITENGYYEPQFNYTSDLGGQYIAVGGDEHCYRTGDTIKVMFPSGNTKELDLAALVKITKYTGQNLNQTITVKDSSDNAVTVTDGKIALSAIEEYIVTYTVSDEVFFDKDGNDVDLETITYSWNVTLSVSLKDTAIPNAKFGFDSNQQIMGYKYTVDISSLSGGNKQYIPFLAGLKIYDYIGQDQYLRFDGDSDFNKIAAATITGYTSANHVLIKVTLVDGGVINIDTTARAASGGSTYTGKLQTSDNKLYYVNDGLTDTTTTTWVISNYNFVGNNGVEVNSGAVTFAKCESGTVPSDSFSTTIKHTVNYDANGGDCGQTTGYATSVASAVTLPTPTRSNYVFDGWYTAASGGTRVGGAGDSYQLTANITLYAQWKTPITVNFDANGGQCEISSATYSNSALTLPQATMDGAAFVGWFTEKDGGIAATSPYTPEKDITLYAHWSEFFDVTLVYNDGVTENKVLSNEDGQIVLPSPTREHYTFGGWFTASGEQIITPTEKITLYAQWERITFTVTYNVNGGNSINPNVVVCNSGESVTLPTPTRDKSSFYTYTFKGWYTAASGGDSVANPYTPEKNITLYAQWSTKTTCVTPNTLVTLADGAQKRIDELVKGDELMAWDFVKAEYTSVPVILIINHGVANDIITTLIFDDGTTLETINGHGFFHKETNSFVDISHLNVVDYLGQSFVTQDGSTVKLIDFNIREESTESWAIVTSVHYNCILNGMLTVSPNYYLAHTADDSLQYDANEITTDIEKYGLFTYDEFDEYFTYEEFVALNIKDYKIAIGKGRLSYDEFMEIVQYFVECLD